MQNLYHLGLVAALNAIKDFENRNEQHSKHKIVYSDYTIIGCLAKYISTPNSKFQPMNANFGILPKLDEKIKDKKERYKKLADRAIEAMNNQKSILTTKYYKYYQNIS